MLRGQWFLRLQSTDKSDESAAANASSPTKFALLNADGEELPRQNGEWVISYQGRPLRILIETSCTGRQTTGRPLATATLFARGPNFTEGQTSLRWKFEPRRVEIALKDTQRPPLVEPGTDGGLRTAGTCSEP